MNKLRQRPPKSRALSIYFAYIFVLVILIAIVLCLLWWKLSDYQKGLDAKKKTQTVVLQPEQTENEKSDVMEAKAQKTFQDYVKGMDAAMWTELWLDGIADNSEKSEVAYAYFEEALKGGVTYYKDLSWDERKPVYKVKLGDRDAARFTMVKGVMPDESGSFWSVGKIEMLMQGDYDAQQELPDGMRFLCNGKEIPADEGSGKSYFPYKGIEDLLQGEVLWYEHEAKGLLQEPETDIACDGEYIWSEEDGCYICLAEDVPEDLMSRAEGFFRAYMTYTMSGGSGWKDYKAKKEEADANGTQAPANPVKLRFDACCQYIPYDSVAYNMLYKAFDSTCYGLAYTEQDPGLIETRGPLRWADNCVSVEFVYHAYATLNGQRKDYSGSDQLFRVFFINTEKGWKIWAFSA